MKKIFFLALTPLILLGCNQSEVINPITREPIEIDLTSCHTYFDGCNTCEVVDGVVESCTEMACAEMQEPKCIQKKSAENTVDLSQCESYFDGCNTCMVLENNELACTRKMCAELETPRCLKEKSAENSIEEPEEIDVCASCEAENWTPSVCRTEACAPQTDVISDVSASDDENACARCATGQWDNEICRRIRCGEISAEEIAVAEKSINCENLGGTFHPAHGECTGIDKSSCDTLKGEFNECASPCRHDPEAEICIMSCDQTCYL